MVAFQAFTLLTLGVSFTNAAVKLNAPASLGEGASAPVSQSWLGWAVESSAFPDFSNNFSQNIFADFAARTGGDVIFRVGGTSMDHSSMNLTQEKAVFRPVPRTNLRSPIVFGQKWFESFEKFKGNTKFIIHAPMGNLSEKQDSVAFVKECVTRMNVKNLYAVQFGNEPDIYTGQKVRKEPFFPGDFVMETANYIKAIEKAITNLPKGRIFQVFEKSSEIYDSKPKWHYVDNFMEQLVNATDINRIKAVALHYYSGGAHTPIQDLLLNPNRTEQRFNSFFKKSIQYMQQHHSHIDFAIDEIGSALGNREDGPDLPLSASVGTSIWTVDWMLNAMFMNVSRINMQQGTNFSIAAWRPADPTPHVQGGFYGHALVADFIGHGRDQGALRVKKLETAQKQNPHITAYTGFNGGKLSKVVLTNQKYWTGSNPPSPEKVSVTLRGIDNNVKKVTARRITSPSGDSQTGILYAGLDWRGDGTPKLINQTNREIPVHNGSIEVNLPAMEAWLITW